MKNLLFNILLIIGGYIIFYAIKIYGLKHPVMGHSSYITPEVHSLSSNILSLIGIMLLGISCYRIYRNFNKYYVFLLGYAILFTSAFIAYEIPLLFGFLSFFLGFFGVLIGFVLFIWGVGSKCKYLKGLSCEIQVVSSWMLGLLIVQYLVLYIILSIS